MAKRLFVGNLSWNVTDETLKAPFAEVGTVESATVVVDRRTGRSSGFGFVEMSTDEEAAKAIAEVNGKELDGRPLRVDMAKPREERPARDFSDRGPRPSY